MIYNDIKRAIFANGSIDVPDGLKPVRVQAWAHTLAGRMGIKVKTVQCKRLHGGKVRIHIRQVESDCELCGQ